METFNFSFLGNTCKTESEYSNSFVHLKNEEIVLIEKKMLNKININQISKVQLIKSRHFILNYIFFIMAFVILITTIYFNVDDVFENIAFLISFTFFVFSYSIKKIFYKVCFTLKAAPFRLEIQIPLDHKDEAKRFVSYLLKKLKREKLME